MFELTVRQKIAAIVLLVFLTIGGLLVFLTGNRGLSKEYTAADISDNKIYVQICGAVKKSGVVVLKPGTRKFEALEAAGGALPDADLNRVNLAEFIEDGEQVYVPKKGEVMPDTSKKRSGRKTSKTKDREESSSGSSVLKKSKIQGVVNLNTATQAQLEAVPGVGPFLAGKIIEYRNKHGLFQNYEDLDKVYGIGPSKLEKLRQFLSLQ